MKQQYISDQDSELLKEEVMLNHYATRKSMVVTDEDTESALARLHARMDDVQAEKKPATRRRTLWRGFGYGIAASLLIVIGVGLFWHIHQQPVTIFMANNDVSNNITLQRAEGDYLVVGDAKDADAMNAMGGTLDKDAEELVYNNKEGEVSPQILTTPPQRSFKVILADGTRVYLNANSQLSYPSRFEGEKRVVHLSGEAYFEVAKDASHPFLVQTENLTTKVLGTHFNVRSYSKTDTHVTLLEGAVEVKDDNGSDAMLKPGFDATIGKDGKLKVQEVDTDLYCSWKDGFFYFDNAPLSEVAREIGRWYNVDVVFATQSSLDKKVLFSASRDSSLTDVVKLLNTLGKANFRIKGGDLYVE